MAGKTCNVCGKSIDAASRTGKCSLCEIGLTPTTRLQRDWRSLDAANASGRTLSGAHCPGCQAELSLADISLRRCSICESEVHPEALEISINLRQTARDETFQPFKTITDA